MNEKRYACVCACIHIYSFRTFLVIVRSNNFADWGSSAREDHTVLETICWSSCILRLHKHRLRLHPTAETHYWSTCVYHFRWSFGKVSVHFLFLQAFMKCKKKTKQQKNKSLQIRWLSYCQQTIKIYSLENYLLD